MTTGPTTATAPTSGAPQGAAPGWGRWEDLPQGRTLVMGILNVTPDSFSDGGAHDTHDRAIAHGLRLAEQGADLIDIGGESTRPGSERVDPQEEQRRILPVIRELTGAGIVVSVDTFNPSTAEAALDAGAHCINDVSGTAVREAMIPLVAERQAPYILMHSRGTPGTMDDLAHYEDLVTEVLDDIEQVAERFLAAGLAPERLVVDPGLGFAKGGRQDWDLLAALPRFVATGRPVLVAGSRKRFLGRTLGQDDAPRPAAERDIAMAAVSALSADRGAWGVRVHDVAASVDAVTVAHAWNGIQPARRRPGRA